MFVWVRRGGGFWLLLALVWSGLVSHHCVLPPSASPAPPHSHHEPGSDGDHHGISAAPCDIVVAKIPAATAVPALVGKVFDLSEASWYEGHGLPVAGLIYGGAGPPLYLLHASLLI